MQINMKATEQELSNLRKHIAAARRASGLRNADLGRIANVDASQVSRISQGDFKTISNNVVQICKALGLEIESLRQPADRGDAAWSKLEASVRRLWDDTPQGADRIATLLDKIAELQQP